jgi:multiple sugar transport system substrate-binding protein
MFRVTKENEMSASKTSIVSAAPPHRPAARSRTRARTAVIALGTAAALVGSLAACSSSSSSGKITLVMWQQWGGGHERKTLDTMIKKYESIHPNIVIKETPVTNNAKILASITGGNPPDIVDLGNSLPLGAWASAGAIIPLDSYIKKSNLDTSVYIKSGLTAMQEGGKTYGLPYQLFMAGLIYNKQLFSDAGLDPNKPPTTLEELAADAKVLTKTDASGKITQMGFLPAYPGPDQGQTCPLISYGYAFGGSWTSASGTPTPTKAANVAALTWEKSFYDTYGVSKIQNFVQSSGSYLTGGDPLESGKLAMMFDGPWSVLFTKDNSPKVAAELGVEPLPASSTNPSSAGSTYIDANAQVIPAGTKNPQAAFDFIKWETTNAQETSTFSNDVANIPQLKSAPGFALEKNPLFAEYLKIAAGPNAKSWTQTANSSTYGTNLCQAQDASNLNGTDPLTALKAVKTQ